MQTGLVPAEKVFDKGIYQIGLKNLKNEEHPFTL